MQILIKEYFKKTLSFFALFGIFSGILTESPLKANIIQHQAIEIFSQEKYFGKNDVVFEENVGQTDSQVKFISRGKGYLLYLTEKEAVFSLKPAQKESETTNKFDYVKSKKQRKSLPSETLRMKFVNTASNLQVQGKHQFTTKTNYYIGQNRYENISNYQKVYYQNIYQGVEAVFYGKNGNLEYDFNVSPEADASQIKLEFSGAEKLLVDDEGNLIIETENAKLLQRKPIAYQEINGERKEVEAGYRVEGKQVSFVLGEYDKNERLVIDPVVNYLTYIGGAEFDRVFDLTADNEGNAYICGHTRSLNFHGEVREENDSDGAYVAKINPEGTGFVYLTILEGNGSDEALGITIDADKNVYVTGEATRNFPTTQGAFSTIMGVTGYDSFITKLSVNGNIVYSTYIGGTSSNDIAFDIAVDSGGKAYITGNTYSGITFPQKNRYQGCGFGLLINSSDVFLTVLNASGSDITYSTCIGGNITGNDESGFSVSLDNANNAYITGKTNAGNFPVKNAFQPVKSGGTDAFAVKINPSLSGENSLIYSTFLGGSGTDVGSGIEVDKVTNQAYIVGLTGSTNFPLKNAFRSTNQINEAFVTVLNSTGTALVNSSFLGGNDKEQALNIAIGNNGLVYVTGETISNDFPSVLPFQATRRGLKDAFITKLRFGSGVISSSFLGGNGNDIGNAVAVKGNFIYVGGQTASNNLQTTANVIKGTSNAAIDLEDGFVAKILDTNLDTIGVFSPSVTDFLLKNSLSGGTPDFVVNRGAFADLPVAGDFNNDGIDTVSTFNNGTWKIRNSNITLTDNIVPPITVQFGEPGDLPVVGDWNGDGIDSLGVFRPSVQAFFLSNSITNATTDITINFGIAGDLPLAGDWDGDGIESIALYRPSVGQTFFTNQNVLTPSIDIIAFLGIAEDLPIAGDWNGDGKDTLGLWRPSDQTFFLSDDNIKILPTFVFGINGDKPIAGDWDGKNN